MNWTDDAIVLGGRRFGEGGLILDVLTRTRGRRSALVHGGASRRKRSQYEPGNSLHLSWTARLEEQLGRFDVAEIAKSRAAHYLDIPDALAAISAVTALLRTSLDDGDAAGSALFEATEIFLDALDLKDVWPALYVRWEFGLLSALGFGLDVSTCALSGENDGLTHVSPKTGRAVRGSEAAEYVDRLFRLPEFLISTSAPLRPGDLADGLTLTGHFIDRRLYSAVNAAPPPPRDVLVQRLLRREPASQASGSGSIG